MIGRVRNARLNRILPVLACIAITAGCDRIERQSEPAAVPEIRPGILAGYLQQEALPNSLELVPPPPAADSAALALDEEVSRRSLALRGTPRWELAIEDANLMFPEAAGTFSCALGVPITEQDTPHLYMLIRRTLTDAGLSTYTAKDNYQRKRPFLVNEEPICTPEEEDLLRKDGSYPSGHTALGWAWALILTEIAPERAEKILARGRAFGESRVICNVHWHSDVVQGRFMGAAAVARLHADPAFRADLEAAKAEVSTLRAKGLNPTRDCKAEEEALACEPQPLDSEATILQSWQGDYPVAQLSQLPEKQREHGVGYIADARTFENVWNALKRGEPAPKIDFKINLVLFARNTQFFNRISIGKVQVTNGMVEVLAMETMSAMPIEDKVAMSLAAVPRKDIKSIRTSDGPVAISDESEKRHADNTNNQAKGIWQDAKLRGVDFRALGNEPGWHLEITASEKIVFVGDYGNTTYAFVTPTPSVDQQARTKTYKVQDAQHDLSILIEGRPCQDTMSGEPLETTVTVILDGKKYRGCGKALH